MAYSFAGKRVFLTGAASGIGRATALRLAREGAELYLTDINADGLALTVADARALGAEVPVHRALDISDYHEVAHLAVDIHTHHGAMDIVCNIAGISAWGTVEHLTHQHWRSMIDVNLMGPISVLECFVPPMIEAGRGGHIVNVSSAAGLFGLPWHAAYSASKFGLRGVSEVLRFDLRRHGIGVSLVCPGAVRTPLVGTVEIVGVDREQPGFKALTEHFERRAVTPEHVAAKILDGIRRNRYMVFTSRDIQIGHWVQRKFSPPYTLAMRRLNDQLSAFAERRQP